jgi:hypothetical protein
VPRKLTVVLATVAAMIAGGLGVPASALACGGGPSSVNVYKECIKNAGGGQSAGSVTPTKPVHISTHATKALAHAGKDRRLLQELATNPGYGATRDFSKSAPIGPVSAPGFLAAALDLGSGPTALLAILAGTAAALFVAAGWRGWRARQRRLVP